MNKNVVSVREMQRNNAKIIEQVSKTKRPVYVTRYFKPKVVILDVEGYENLYRQAKSKRSWEEVKKKLDWIASGGKQKTNLAKFIYDDRRSH